MKMAVMQPYLFPYLGYFQLMHGVDQFILLDDVPYSRTGWSNRNRLLGKNGAFRFTFAVQKSPRGTKISEIQLDNKSSSIRRFMKSIDLTYAHAPQYSNVKNVILEAISCNSDRFSDFTAHSIQVISSYLGLETQIQRASASQYPAVSGAEEKILSICTREKATEYLNSSNGERLYTKSRFHDAGVGLNFLTHIPKPYHQWGLEFQSHLSIIDVLMHNDRDALTPLLSSYDIKGANQ